MKQQAHGTGPDHGGHGGRGGHGLMMIACCIPMLVIAGVLVATGVVSASFLVYALVCTAMMAFMMRGMHGGAAAPPAPAERSQPTEDTKADTHHGSGPS